MQIPEAIREAPAVDTLVPNDVGAKGAALIGQEAQLRLVVDNASVYLANFDRGLRFTFVNDGYARRIGLRASGQNVATSGPLVS
jgi:hypothetical protein